MVSLYGDKCLGAFLATAIGDALGWPFENKANNIVSRPQTNGHFQQWTRKVGAPYWSHPEIIECGEYSDDTQLMLAVARSLLYGPKWNQHFIKQELPFWLTYERGGGIALKSAAKAWGKRHGNPWSRSNNSKDISKYFNAGANGVAMRILPHVVYNLDNDNVDELIETVQRNGMYTHGHPRALLGATCFAYALYIVGRKAEPLKYGELIEAVLEGSDKWGKFHPILPEWQEIGSIHLKRQYLDVWRECVERICNNLKGMQVVLKSGMLDDGENYLRSIGCLSPDTNGAGDVSALTAIYFASKYAANPKQAIMAAAYLKGSDTDTNASMTGALVGMIQGTDWIPYEWLAVQDYQYIKSLPFKLLEHRCETENSLTFLDGCSVIGKPTIYNGKNYTVSIQKYKTEWGQTIYIKSQTQYRRETRETSKIVPKVIYEQMQISFNNNTYEFMSLLKEINEIDPKINVGKLVDILNMLMTTTLSEKEIYDATRVKKSTIAKIRERFINRKI